MAIEMNDINATMSETLKRIGLEPTIDNRIQVLSELAKKVSVEESIEPDERVRVALQISVEIVRLRIEKQMFGLD